MECRLLTIDESGDFVSWVRSPTSGVIDSATYGSLFDIRRLHAPADLDFSNINRNLAAQPQPVSLGPVSLMGSWFKTSQALTGAQIDDLCAFSAYFSLLSLCFKRHRSGGP